MSRWWASPAPRVGRGTGWRRVTEGCSPSAMPSSTVSAPPTPSPSPPPAKSPTGSPPPTGPWSPTGDGRVAVVGARPAGHGSRRGEAGQGGGQLGVVGERRQTRLAFPVDGFGELHPDPAPRVVPVRPVTDELL